MMGHSFLGTLAALAIASWSGANEFPPATANPPKPSSIRSDNGRRHSGVAQAKREAKKSRNRAAQRRYR